VRGVMRIREQHWLITGGLGYIGKHVAQTFAKSGIKVDLLDSRLPDDDEFLPEHQNYYNLDIRKGDDLFSKLKDKEFTGIVHLAGKKSVRDSFLNIENYFDINVRGTRNMLDYAQKFNVDSFIFASSCSVYGESNQRVVNENFPKHPISPYAKSKDLAEDLILGYSKYFKVSILRFFNIIGCLRSDWKDKAPDSLVPATLERLRRGQSPKIYGNQFNTPDGTAERDYLDTRDLSEYIFEVAQLLNNRQSLPSILNLGSGKSVSVLQIVNEILEVYGIKSDIEFSLMRKGDPSSIRSDISRMNAFLAYRSRFNLGDSLSIDCAN
jgi:UDP-glucose 4-epimerase